jgi:hypothetical protein
MIDNAEPTIPWMEERPFPFDVSQVKKKGHQNADETNT